MLNVGLVCRPINMESKRWNGGGTNQHRSVPILDSLVFHRAYFSETEGHSNLIMKIVYLFYL